MHSGSGRRSARAIGIMIAAWAFLPVALAFPGVRLNTTFSRWLCGLTNTAGVTGVVLIGLAFVGLFAFRSPRARNQVLREILVHVGVLALLLGGGALVNEHLIKEALAAPRPHIVRLAELGELGMTAEHFYASMSKQERRHHLQHVLTDPSFDAIPLASQVREQWVHETGYSLPSGHTFTVMLLSTYFLAMRGVLGRRRRRWLFDLLPGWAVWVAWSRVLLGVHRPEDIVCGGLAGVVLGAAAVWLSHRLLNRGKSHANGHGFS